MFLIKMQVVSKGLEIKNPSTQLRINGLSILRLRLLAQLHKVFVKQRNGFNPFQVIEYSEMFIWRVNGIAVQTESHQDGF